MEPESCNDWDEIPGLVDTDDEGDEGITPDPKPKWRSMIYIYLNRKRRPVLVDSGCSGSCISYEYFINNPYLKKYFTPHKTCGKAINGSDVPAIGAVCLKFHLAGTPMSITCRVVKGLMDPVIIGWDWMTKYGIVLDAEKGTLTHKNKVIPLIDFDIPLPGPVYRVYEELVLPPNSKVHTHVEIAHNGSANTYRSATVVTEPLSTNGATYWASRNCSTVKDNRFMTEFMNTTDKAIKIPAGEIIGHAKFVKDKQWGSKYYHTQMAACQFDPDLGLGEAPPSSDPKESETTQDPHSSQDPEATHVKLFACDTEDARVTYS